MTGIAKAAMEASYIITVIINSIASPFIILLNVLVIMAVKTRSRLRTNSNILLACLALTDALTGLLGQPSFILWRIFLLLSLSKSETARKFHINVMGLLVVASCLHLMLVTFERLIAIKCTMQYSKIVTHNTMRLAAVLVWIIASITVVLELVKMSAAAHSMSVFLIISCIFLVSITYVILFHETRRHQKKIKAQQLPQEEVKRFTKETKALKTTLFVFSAVIFCHLPLALGFISLAAGFDNTTTIIAPWWQTCAMLNSLFDPLIYCWRKKEMRKFVSRIRNQVGHSTNE